MDTSQPTTPCGRPLIRRRTLQEVTDAELLALVNRGNNQALSILYERHRSDALRYARRLSHRLDDRTAEDILSEAIRRILSALNGGRGPMIGFREYLFTTVRAVSIPTTRTRHNEDLHDTIPATDARLDDTLDGVVAMQAFESLPQRWQRALWSSVVADQKPVEIAAALGLSSNAVAALLKRARDALRIAYIRTYLPQPASPACRQATESLARSAVTTLTARQQRNLDDHLDHCEACRDTARTIRREIATWTRSPRRTRTHANSRVTDTAQGVTSTGVA